MTAPSTLAPSFSALGASWRLVVVVALCALPGCAEPEPAEVLVDVAPSMSREEAVSELFRNLGEAVAAQKARRSGAAISHWRAAHAVFQQVVEPELRARRPERALPLEYAFGRMRAELERRSGAVGAAHQDLERMLEEALSELPAEGSVLPASPAAPADL